MSGNHSDSESSLSDWELVQQGDLQDNEVADNEGSSSGSEFVHLDCTAVSYHHRPSEDRDVVEIGDDDLTDLSQDTLQASAIHADGEESKVPEEPAASASLSSATPTEANETEQVSEEITVTESCQPESCAAASLDQCADLKEPSPDQLSTGDVLEEAQGELDDPPKQEEVPAPPVEGGEVGTETLDNGSENSNPSEPELLDLSDAKSTDTESEVEILITSDILAKGDFECDAVDSPDSLESPPSSDEVLQPDAPESDLTLSHSDEPSASQGQGHCEDQDEPGASFMAGAPHEYLQSLAQMGTVKVVVVEHGVVEEDAGSGAEDEQGAVGGDTEEDGIQVLEVEEENPVEKREEECSDDESLPESDISLIDDESDLSNQDQFVDEMTLFDPVKIRQYKHNPNNNVNTILSLVMGAVLALGIGIGIGHAFGSSNELLFRRHHDDTFTHQGETDEVRNLRQTLQTCATKRDDMEARIYEYQQGKLSVILSELHDRVGHLEKQNKHLKKDIQRKTVYMEQVSDENRDMKSRVENMHHNLSNLTLSLEEIKSQKTLLEGRNTDERKANSELKKNLTDFKLELERAKENKRMLEIEKNMQISDLQGRVIDLGTELEDVKEHKNQLMQSHETFAVQLNQAKNKLDDLSRSKEDTEQHNSFLLKDLKTRLNTLLVENMDLKAEVARLRYRQHPANPDQVALFKEKVNVLRVENEELQSAVSKSRYTHGPTENQESDNKLQEENQLLEKKVKELSDNLALEQNRSDMWQTLFLSEKARKNSTTAKEEKNFMDCVKIVFSRINITEFTSVFNESNSKNLTRAFMEKVSFVFHATKKMNFSDYVNKKWGAFYNFSQSNEFKDAFKYAENGYENFQDMLVMQWKHFQNYTNSDNFQKHVNQTKDIISQMKETVDKTISKVQNFSNSDHVKEYINKTKETMSKLSVQIKETWSRLKNISSGLYKSHEPKVRKVQDDVASTLFEFGKTIKDRFGKFGDEYHAKFDKGTKRGREWADQGREEKRKTGGTEYHEEQPDKTGRKYESDFKPEPNCKMINKKFKELKNIVESLSKKRWYRIENSDREEILEDFDEFNNQYLRMGGGLLCLVGDNDVAWLNCQISWWRASLSETLDAEIQRSCEDFLVRWQLKVTKKYLKEVRKRNKHAKVKIVITPEARKETESRQKETEKEKQKTEWDAAQDNLTFFGEPAEGDKDRDKKSDKVKSDWYLKRAEDREDYRHDPKWYFRRMDDREDGRHDVKWLFSRAEDRANKHRKSILGEEDGTYGCTKRRGESGCRQLACQPQKKKENIPEKLPLQQDDGLHNFDFHPGKEGFYDDPDWNDPDFWKGY
ncbi:uncharacterized protein LOC135482708 isoform X2 [Lineus longissimus]|uniref:uncharacterized protein LOC135482708 isoform X2 n=1 Tax=Lineus longissimus TaxID=88925 RepID=UPI00315C811D